MKRIVKTAAAMLAALMLTATPAAAQTADTKPQTEQTAGTSKTKKAKAPKTEAELLKNATPTGETHTDDKTGKRYPVYAGAKGGKFYIRVSSKTGYPYRAYIKSNKNAKK